MHVAAMLRSTAFCFLTILVFGTSCSKEDTNSAISGPTAMPPELAALVEAIDLLKEERLRGNSLSAVSREAQIEVLRVKERTRAAAIGLSRDEQSVAWLTELVRSRDLLENVELLVQDLDFVGLLRDRLNRAVEVYLALQNRTANELADPEVARALFDQRFSLKSGLGSFYAFIETKSSSGPRMFEARSFQVGGNTIENISTRLDRNQVMWLLSPQIDLSEARELQLAVRGTVRGPVFRGEIRGFRVFVSESFAGQFTPLEGGGTWEEITEEATRLPSANSGGFADFSSEFYFGRFAGKKVVLAIRLQGADTNPTDFQFRQISLRGKGSAQAVAYRLIAPEAQTVPSEPSEPVKPVEPIEPLPPSEPKDSLLSQLPACALPALDSNIAIELPGFCHIAFDGEEAFKRLLRYNERDPDPASLFKKYTRSRDGALTQATNVSGWKTSCSEGRPASLPAPSFCAQRVAETAYDLLIGPALKVPEGAQIKVYSTLTGNAWNVFDADGNKSGARFRVLLLPASLAFDSQTTPPQFVYQAEKEGPKLPLDPIGTSDFDAILADYPQLDRLTLTEPHQGLTISAEELRTRTANYTLPVRVALLLHHTNRRGAGAENSSAWFVHEITFEKAPGGQ